jgi:hypothetical protein
MQYKQSSLYEKGMKPLVYSTQRAKDGWRRTGMGVTYGFSLVTEGMSYYKMSFGYEF